MSRFEKQVDKAHYEFESYLTHGRWISNWHQLREVLAWQPESLLEIGSGPGVFRYVCEAQGVKVTSVDIAEDLSPDIVASVTDLPLADDTFDVVCAFQVLEHLPFDNVITAITQLRRVARKAVILSVPNASIRYPQSIHLPKCGKRNLLVPIPFLRPPVLKPGGEHYWEISQGVTLKQFKDLFKNAQLRLLRDFRVPENPYHHFFVLTK